MHKGNIFINYTICFKKLKLHLKFSNADFIILTGTKYVQQYLNMLIGTITQTKKEDKHHADMHYIHLIMCLLYLLKGIIVVN